MQSPIVDFANTMFNVRDQAHFWHWKTKSYAQHMALGAFYEGLVPLVDGLVESWMGKYGWSTFPQLPPVRGFSQNSPQEFIAQVAAYVESVRVSLGQDSWVQNQIDTIAELVQSTKYKLDNLA